MEHMASNIQVTSPEIIDPSSNRKMNGESNFGLIWSYAASKAFTYMYYKCLFLTFTDFAQKIIDLLISWNQQLEVRYNLKNIPLCFCRKWRGNIRKRSHADGIWKIQCHSNFGCNTGYMGSYFRNHHDVVQFCCGALRLRTIAGR